ncbi:MAG: hypothetical protein AAB065_05745 [Deltaproteobacteria bacterium]
MSSASETSQGNQGLRALDPDIAMLASEAAIDIDNMLLHGSKELKAMRRLAERLNNSIEANTVGTWHSLMDPVTLTILSEAVAEAKHKSLQKVEELLDEAANIAKTLSSDRPMENPEELRQAGDFCVALSNAVIGYRKSIYDLCQPHPSWR